LRKLFLESRIEMNSLFVFAFALVLAFSSAFIPSRFGRTRSTVGEFFSD